MGELVQMFKCSGGLVSLVNMEPSMKIISCFSFTVKYDKVIYVASLWKISVSGKCKYGIICHKYKFEYKCEYIELISRILISILEDTISTNGAFYINIHVTVKRKCSTVRNE
jgi:hypothetical protein